MVYVCFKGEAKKNKKDQCYFSPFLSNCGSAIHYSLLRNRLNKRNVYLEYKEINIRFFIFLRGVLIKVFCRGPPFSLVAKEQRKKEAHMI